VLHLPRAHLLWGDGVNWTAKTCWKLTGLLTVLLMLPHCRGGEARSQEDSASVASIRDSSKVAGEPVADVCSSGGWCWMNPSFPSDSFLDSWAVDSRNVFAVGPPDRVLHWRDGDWTYVHSGTQATLYAVWGSSSTDAWAVGGAGTIVHWDGVRWTQVREGGPTLRALFGTGPQDIWAGGEGGTLLHWNGSQWHGVPSGTKRAIRALWSSGGQDVWVSVFNPEDLASALRRWNGQEWSTVMEYSGMFIVSIYGFGPEDVWIAGGKGLLAHWTGKQWQQARGTDSSANHVQVRGHSSTDLWVSGSSLWHFDGTTLTAQQYEYSAALYPSSIAVGANGPLLAVGSGGASLRYLTGSRWEIQIPASGWGTRLLRDVWAYSPEQAWVVDDAGGLLQWDGVSWSQVTNLPAALGLSAISGTSASELWVAGRMGDTDASAIAHFDGTRWSKTLFPQADVLTDVWALHSKSVWAVDRGGSILHWDGWNWTLAADVDQVLLSVHGSSDDNVWAVGTSGGVFQWNGQQWVNRRVESGPSFQAVWAFAPDNVWCAADDGSLWHWDGQALQSRRSGVTTSLNALFGRGPEDLWVTGDNGVTLHWDGQAWTRIASGTSNRLMRIWGGRDSLFTVGSGAAILYRESSEAGLRR
jgi:hypothetical protein